MAFSFGTTPAPASNTGGFTFGAPSGAPATSSGTNLFGTQSTGSLFGNQGSSTPGPAPAGGGFFAGNNPAPAPSGGGFFSAAPSPATGSGLFGSATSTPAPAPSGGLFGSSGSGFGSTSAPSPFGAPAQTSSFFGAPQPAPGGTPAGPPPALAGYMPYANLPSDQKQPIDAVYNAIMQHKRTILAVSAMAPRLLEKSTQQADAAAGQELPLSVTVQQMSGQAHQLDQRLKSLRESILRTKKLYETSTTQAISYAKWPTEFVAARSGVTLSTSATALTASGTQEEVKKTEDFYKRLKALLDQEMTRVDQVERMPSPYLWQCIEEMEGRYQSLESQLQALKYTLENAKEVSAEDLDIVSIVQMQEQTIWKVAADLARAHTVTDQLRQLYTFYEKGENVLDAARREDIEYQQRIDQKMKMLMVKNLSSKAPAPAPTTSIFGSTPGPSAGGLFGSTPSSGGIFGSTPAPSSGSLFASTATSSFGNISAPSPGGAFGGTAAPSPGGIFGSSSAPSSGGLFGSSTNAPAPFGASSSTTANTSAPGSSGLFGTPASAPGSSQPAFGTPASTAGGSGAPAFPSFGSTPATSTGFFSSTSSTPKAKNKSRSTRRR